MSMRYQAGIVLPGYNALKVANAPTIGTATAGNTQVSVAFTAPACTGGGAISSYTAYCTTTGAKTASGASSPLVVTGLTNCTAYTFKVTATNAYGPSYPSAASNSVTPTLPATSQLYSSPGTYSWVAPTGVTSVAVVAIGGAAGGTPSCSSGGAGLGYRNGYSVTPGNSYTVVVGAGGSGSNTLGVPNTGNDSYFVSTSVVKGGKSIGGGGGNYTGSQGGGYGGPSCAGGGGGPAYVCNGGGRGGTNSTCGHTMGYCGTNGGAGGGGGGSYTSFVCSCITYSFTGQSGGGGGTGVYGQGSSGTGGSLGNPGAGGSGGASGSGKNGGAYGGGAGRGGYNYNSCCGFYGLGYGGNGGGGAVRIVWCVGGYRGTPSFPSTNVGAP